jgi:hypothetical protein
MFVFCFAAYTLLKPVSGQWNISIEKASGSPDFVPVACDQPAVTAACNQPLLAADKGGALKFTYQHPEELKTVDGLVAKSLRFQACYAAPSTKDRPWRKASDIIDVSVPHLM